MPRLTKILHRRDTAANWSSTNPTLDSSEIGYDSTNKMLKIGDGSTAWNSLPAAGVNPSHINGAAISGAIITPMGTSQTVSVTNGRCYLTPIYIDRGCTANQISAVVVTTAGSAGSVIRLGIYSHGTNAPDALIVDAGTVSATTTGAKSITISQSFTANTIYWLAVVPQGAPATNPTLIYTQSGNPLAVPITVPLGTNAVNAYRIDSVTGALPANASAGFYDGVSYRGFVKIA